MTQYFLFYFFSPQHSGSLADAYYSFSHILTIILPVCEIICWHFTHLEFWRTMTEKIPGWGNWEKAAISICTTSLNQKRHTNCPREKKYNFLHFRMWHWHTFPTRYFLFIAKKQSISKIYFEPNSSTFILINY